MPIRFIASDLDGTLLTGISELSAYTAQVMHRCAQNGIKIAVATGRAYDTMPPCIFENRDIDYAITSNGAAVYDLKNKHLLTHSLLPADSVRQLAAYATEHNLGLEFICNGKAYGESYYFDHPDRFCFDERSVQYLFSTRTRIENLDLFLNAHVAEIESVNYVLRDPQMKPEISARFCNDTALYITSSNPLMVEFSAAGSGKANALRYLLKKEGMHTTQLAAFGNAQNDLEMIHLAHIGVATANSPQEVKSQCAYVCGACEEDGVAHFIEEHIL